MGDHDKTDQKGNHQPVAIVDNVVNCLRKIIQSYYLYSHYLHKEVGLTAPQLAVLQQIRKKRQLTVGEIAKSISLSQATVTGILERLENRGLVVRQRSRSDRRKVFVDPTPAGIQLLTTSPPIIQESFVSAFDELQDWEKSMILSALQRLVQLMEARQDGIAPGATGDRLEIIVDPHMTGE